MPSAAAIPVAMVAQSRQPGQRPPTQRALHQRLGRPPERQRNQQSDDSPRVGAARRPKLQGAEADKQGGEQRCGRAGQPARGCPDCHHGEKAQQPGREAQAEHAVAGGPEDQTRTLLEKAARAGYRFPLHQPQPVDALAAGAARRQVGQIPEAQQRGAEQKRSQPDKLIAAAEAGGGGHIDAVTLGHERARRISAPLHRRRGIFDATTRPPRADQQQRQPKPPGKLEHQRHRRTAQEPLRQPGGQRHGDPGV